MKNPYPCLLPLGLLLFVFSCSSPAPAPDPRLAIAEEMESHLNKEVLNVWYPRAVDTVYGGFLSSFTYDFQPAENQDKMIVTQARHTWSNSKAALHFPNDPGFKANAEHGFRFLRDVMWDSANGGFFQLTDRKGTPKDSMKTAYGNAFGIYALAAYYNATQDTAGLALAKKAFLWLEEHSHDPALKGYFQHLRRDGSPISRPAGTPGTSDLGYKDQNSSIHLLEAFTELYQVWPDSLLRERLQEMLLLIRDKIVTPKGYLTLFLQPDWTPVTFRDSSEQVIRKHASLDHVSFGHDVETGYLLIEASHVLGLENDTTTERIAKKMIDHALANGWDDKVGGFYDEGYYFKDKPGMTILLDTKNWWAQAEGMNALLLMANRYPEDDMKYFDRFQKQWEYCKKYLIDHEHGDWYAGGLDKQPDMKTALKGHIWKANYHQYRALENCISMLRSTNMVHD